MARFALRLLSSGSTSAMRVLWCTNTGSSSRGRTSTALPPAAMHALDVFADLQDADHIVNAVGIHGQTAVALLAHVGEDLLRGIVHVHGGDVHARRDDALDRHVGKRQGRAHELAALGGQLPVVGHVLDDVGQLILRHGHGGLALYAAGDGVAEGGEQGRQGLEEHHEKPQ